MFKESFLNHRIIHLNIENEILLRNEKLLNIIYSSLERKGWNIVEVDKHTLIDEKIDFYESKNRDKNFMIISKKDIRLNKFLLEQTAEKSYVLKNDCLHCTKDRSAEEYAAKRYTLSFIDEEFLKIANMTGLLFDELKLNKEQMEDLELMYGK